MAPIIDIQRKLHEAGRIRIGQKLVSKKSGKSYPGKLETFRLTTSSEKAVWEAAAAYGGEPHPWDDAPTAGQWELFTDKSVLNILLPPEAMSFSQFYEVWSGGGCKIRCDGERDYLNEQECSCDPESRLCKPHTRLSVMLSELRGAGMWRLDTQGYYAATELGGAFELAGIISRQTGRSLLPATLRLDQRESVTEGETRKYAVPVVDFDIDMAAIAAGGLTPVQALGSPKSLAEQLEAVDHGGAPSTRKNAAEPVTPTGTKPRPRSPEVERVIDPEASQALIEFIERMTDDEREKMIAHWKSSPIPYAKGVTTDEASTLTGAAMAIMDGQDPAVTPPEAAETVTGPIDPPATPRAAPDESEGQYKPFTEDDEDPTIKPTALRPQKRGTTAARPTTQISTKQVGMIRAKLANEGVHDDDDVHDAVGMILGGIAVESLNDLTKAQASKVIDALIDREG